MASAPSPNSLYYGDCLDWMRQWPHESVDLIYLDPPFNSNANYNILFGKGNGVSAQMRGFTDTWKWNEQAAERVGRIEKAEGTRVQKPVKALKELIGECGMLAYLSYMGERLEVMRHLLKPTGSIYLHCDPTASHYLKTLMDSLFGGEHFRNEIIWQRTNGHPLSIRKFEAITDTILYYNKAGKFLFNGDSYPMPQETIDRQFRRSDDKGRYTVTDLSGGRPGGEDSYKPFKGVLPPTGRAWAPPRREKLPAWAQEELGPGYDQLGQLEKCHELDRIGLIHWSSKGKPNFKRYLMPNPSMPVPSLWLDIPPARGSEHMGYQTQKPLALLERIIKASSNPGDLVLDPFCGCGTAVVAAHNLGRRWLGIDISPIAIDIIQSQRLKPRGIEAQAHGIPQDLAGARRLAADQHFKFEEWAVTRIDGLVPNERQTGDGGIDGRGRMLAHAQTHDSDLVLAQVTGSRGFRLDKFRDFLHVVERENAAAGVYITLDRRGSDTALAEAGAKGEIIVGASSYPRVQVWSIADYFDGRTPQLPTLADPYTGKPVQSRLG